MAMPTIEHGIGTIAHMARFLCWGSDRPDGQAVHPRPVSGVGVVVGGVSEVVGEETIGGNGVEGNVQRRHD